MIIDEYDGENFDQSEARKLNRVINTECKEVFEDADFLFSINEKGTVGR